jgi:hypothetical protein
MTDTTHTGGAISATSNERDILLTLFDLGRQVASVVELDELLERLPALIARLIQFDAFAIYLVDEKRGDLTIAYAVGYPDVSTILLALRTDRGRTNQQAVVSSAM